MTLPDFAWEYPGTQVITVTAENVEGLSSDTISVDVMMPPLSMEVSGSEAGEVGESNIFTATVFPISATVPITYVWTVDGEVVIHSYDVELRQRDAQLGSSRGCTLVSVSATNPAGSVEELVDIHRLYQGFYADEPEELMAL